MAAIRKENRGSRKRTKNEAYLQEVVRSPRGGAGLSLLECLCLLTGHSPGSQPPAPQAQKETRITPEQTKELFRSLNQILTFASDDSQLQIHHEVKKRLITREQVEKYILEKFQG